MLSPDALVLVVVLNQPRDYEILRVLGWYRIPLRHAPRMISVDALAFYQTRAFGDHGEQIRYVAELRGHELVRRVDLLRDEPDHPRAEEEYYKLILGPLQALQTPVRAEKWKRLTFLYSTGERLLQAQTLNDLVVYGEERVNLWHSLRERSQADGAPDDLYQVNLTQEVLATLLGFASAVEGGEKKGRQP